MEEMSKHPSITYPCPYPPGGLCPRECITNDGPLCDFDDDCPYANETKDHEEEDENVETI